MASPRVDASARSTREATGPAGAFGSEIAREARREII